MVTADHKREALSVKMFDDILKSKRNRTLLYTEWAGTRLTLKTPKKGTTHSATQSVSARQGHGRLRGVQHIKVCESCAGMCMSATQHRKVHDCVKRI